MLKEGFHLSFKELFNLIQQQLQEREIAGPESLMWTQTMLQDKQEELDTLKYYLTTAETAQRKGNDDNNNKNNDNDNNSNNNNNK